jgi:hypothetical protein
VGELAAPLWLASYRDLRRFHQKKAQQHVALFADVPEPAPGHQPPGHRSVLHFLFQSMRQFLDLWRQLVE